MSKAQRIKEVRLTLRMTQIEFAKELNLQSPNYSNIERGKNNLTMDGLQLFVEKFKVNPVWYLTGTGSMFLSDQKEKPEIPNNLTDISNYHKIIDQLEKMVAILTQKQELLEARNEKLQSEIDLLKQLLSAHNTSIALIQSQLNGQAGAGSQDFGDEEQDIAV